MLTQKEIEISLNLSPFASLLSEEDVRDIITVVIGTMGNQGR